jgi:hypothetical protein
LRAAIYDISGQLRLGHLFHFAGIESEDVAVIRHTLKPDGLKARADAMGPNLLPYVREQGFWASAKLESARYWLHFLGTLGSRVRFVSAYKNQGEVPAE